MARGRLPPAMGPLRFDWSGANRRASWRQLGEEIGGRCTPATWRRPLRLELPHGPWTMTLECHVMRAHHVHVPFTRFWAPFLATGTFRCRISRANLFTRIAHWLGLQDVVVGEPTFDHAFVVRSNARDTVRAFCQEPLLRQLLLAERAIALAVQDHAGWLGPRVPADTDLLSIDVAGHLQDQARLRALFRLLASGLDRLVAVGAAHRRPPSFTL